MTLLVLTTIFVFMSDMEMVVKFYSGLRGSRKPWACSLLFLDFVHMQFLLQLTLALTCPIAVYVHSAMYMYNVFDTPDVVCYTHTCPYKSMVISRAYRATEMDRPCSTFVPTKNRC